MNQSLQEVLDSLGRASVRVRENKADSSFNLSVLNEPYHVEFNGFTSIVAYAAFLFEQYAPCEDAVNQSIRDTHAGNIEQLKQQLHMLHFKVMDFRRWFFPSSSPYGPIHRIVLENDSIPLTDNPQLIQGLIMQYFDLQLKLLRRLENLYMHRLKHLNYFFHFRFDQPLQQTRDSVQQAVGDLDNPQQSLFPVLVKDLGLRWIANKVDFVEIFTALYESGAVKVANEGRQTRKEFLNSMMLVFSTKISNLEATLAAAKRRKRKNAPFTYELYQTFKGF